MRVLPAFLTLLRAGLWEREVDDLSLFPLTPDEWADVRKMSHRQTVDGIVYQGLCRLPDRLLPPDDQLLRWVAGADAIERHNATMNDAVGSIFAFFRSGGLRPVLLKGQGVARFYERPSLRECGDIDIYFPHKDDMGLAVSALTRRGLRLSADADGCAHCQWQGVPVELHNRLSDVAAPARRRRLSACEREKGFENFVLPAGGGDEIEMPSPFLNLLLLNTHILKHAIGWGIGVRQLCDLARACHQQGAEVSADEMKREIRRLGLLRWTRMLHAFLTEYLGLPPSSLPFASEPISPAPLLGLVMSGGNFGKDIRPDSATSGCSTFRRKVATAGAFSKNALFSLKYAPGEAVWTFLRLFSGQIKNNPHPLSHDN